MFSFLAVRKSGRGPGIFSHVSDVRIEEMVERVLKLCMGKGVSKQHEERRLLLTYHMYLASGGRPSSHQALSM